ncbi:MAG: phosphoribosylanthranilate isomerase [Kiritimatiellae bacterium]|nr:phosphoribosylanthranilate isomerase [Kiritimatiellia bacterium]MDD5520908.1 phosphoribosylanthranilate isomerase [Kiritimatiellia bacterium]
MSVEVKICGITNRDDALCALDLGADYLGFVLYAKSPRAITAKSLSKLLDALNCKCKAIGVFVNECRAQVEKIAVDCGLHAVQIHGDELFSEFIHFPVPVWRAVKFVAGAWNPLPERWKAARYVVDSSVPGMYGGTGVAGNWKEAACFVNKHPSMLSGGLTPENVSEAIRIVRPTGVDTASGVELRPGKKDVGKLEIFLRKVKAEQL